MSLNIDIDEVEAVLLADGWHTVLDASFVLDAYEYVMEGVEEPLYYARAPLSCTGFGFKENVAGKNVWTMGPIESLLAVRKKSTRK